MAGGLLAKWFTKSEPIRNDVTEATAVLARHADERPTLAAPLKLVRHLLPKLYQDLPAAPVVAIEAGAAQAKLDSGIPLLRGENLALDAAKHCARWRELCGVLTSHPNVATEAPADVALLEKLHPTELLAELLAGHPEAIAAQADAVGLDSGLAATLVRLYWFPLLSDIQTAHTPLRTSASWERAECPECGGNPLLAELRGLEQGRFLRCGLCAASWEVPRLLCPFCGARDHHALGYFHVAGEETRYRVTTCEACRRYVKTVCTLSELAGPMLLATDALTLHLDLAAAERGYQV